MAVCSQSGPEAKGSLFLHQFQAGNGSDERGNEKQSPECGRLTEKKDAGNDRSHSPDTGPHCIGGADRQGEGGAIEQVHAYAKANEKGAEPEDGFSAFCGLGFGKGDGKTCLKQAGNDQEYPVHRVKVGAGGDR